MHSKMNVTIRKAEKKDFPSVIFLMKEFAHFQKSPGKVTISVEQLDEDEAYFQCIVAETDDKTIIGFASFFFAYYSWSGRSIYLDDLYITGLYRNTGVGKMLLDNVVSFAKEHKCKKVRWQVSKWNKNAIEFYTQMGAITDDVDINCDLKI